MLEQAFANFDNVSQHKAISNKEAHDASQKMLSCVQLHDRSGARDANDKSINDHAVITDQQSVETANSVKAVDAQLLAQLADNKPIGPSLWGKAVSLHLQSQNLNDADTAFDIAAQTKDLKDIKEEQRVINSDQSLLRSGKISSASRFILQEDIQRKLTLQQNEREDISGERQYIKADNQDSKLNKAVIDALVWNPSQLESMLWADGASKDNFVGTRTSDKQAKHARNTADLRDEKLDAQLNDALRQDPYLSAARRENANLPVWTLKEDQVHQAEVLQHERRRLGLPADANAHALKMAQEADMNKQLGLPVWDTKQQRVLERIKVSKNEQL